jgi:hypothetical protein
MIIKLIYWLCLALALTGLLLTSFLSLTSAGWTGFAVVGLVFLVVLALRFWRSAAR